jgi:hypothetical protein
MSMKSTARATRTTTRRSGAVSEYLTALSSRFTSACAMASRSTTVVGSGRGGPSKTIAKSFCRRRTSHVFKVSATTSSTETRSNW